MSNNRSASEPVCPPDSLTVFWSRWIRAQHPAALALMVVDLSSPEAPALNASCLCGTAGSHSASWEIQGLPATHQPDGIWHLAWVNTVFLHRNVCVDSRVFDDACGPPSECERLADIWSGSAPWPGGEEEPGLMGNISSHLKRSQTARDKTTAQISWFLLTRLLNHVCVRTRSS